MPKKLLIISHTFPPAAGIGGRRWAKFSKYLTRMGYEVTVLCAQNVNKENSVWAKDVEGIQVHSLPYKFPRSVAFPKNDLLNKIKYHLNVYYLKRADQGNYFDRTIFWEKQINEKVSELIEKEKIECVIVTSGPFRLSYHVTRLTEKFPDVKFIVDFRDLWTEDVEITSFASLPKKRKKIEKIYEKRTVYRADKVISVAEDLNAYFASLTIDNKFEVIPNGFDPDDYKDLEPAIIRQDDKIRFVFTGTLYINLEYILKPFFSGIRQLKEEHPELYNKVVFEFVGRFPSEYKRLIAENGIAEAFEFSDPLSLKEVYGKIRGSHYCMLFLNDVYNFALSTKFCEYISQKKKIIVVSHFGPAARFITQNGIGFWMDPEKILEDLKSVIRNTAENNSHKWDSSFDTEQFSIVKITEKLSRVIKEKDKPHFSVDQRHLLLTFDYELFLGKRSGSVDNCILRPTERLLDIFDQYGISGAIFFVDLTYIKRLSEEKHPACIRDHERIREQLIKILKKGNYVFPHLHPHWREAEYISDLNQWKMESTNSYRLHAIPAEESDRYFSFSMEYIKGLMQNAGVNYEVNGYRAGGWCIQPFETYRPYFEKYGIKYDFSALRGFKMPGKNIVYDFTQIPARNIYSFSTKVENADPLGKFKEVVISTIYISKLKRFFNKLLYKVLWYTKRTGYGDGYSAVDGEASVIKSIQNMEKKTRDLAEMVSIELLTGFTNDAYKSYLDNNDFMHFISHPKMIGEHNLHTFEKFIKYANKHYKLNTDYLKMVK
jgi:glycosyltransferase involved in cell wall biosynthesis